MIPGAVGQVRGHPGGLLQFSAEGGAVKSFFASVSSGRCAMWQNRERRHAWTRADGGRSSVICLTILHHHSAHGGTRICQRGRTMVSAWSASLNGGLGAEPLVGGGQGALPPEAKSFFTFSYKEVAKS